jgi:membrane-associated phospholipid phosphatase
MANLRDAEWLALGWFIAAAVLGLAHPLDAMRRRRILLGAAVAVAFVLFVSRLPAHGVGGAFRNVLPALFVLGAYRLSGLFFVTPQEHIERWLLAVDRRVLGPLDLERCLVRGPRWMTGVIEIAYVLVHPMLPLGAWAAWSAAGNAGVDAFWSTVFLAEAASYSALPWIQTRPPRALEPWTEALRTVSPWRRLNEFVLRYGSNQVNTLPSGHAAGAVATALAIASLDAALAGPFVVAAGAILVATVVGRYHFVVDTAAGAAFAIAAWGAVTVWRG